MGRKVKTKVKINPKSKRLDAKELASSIIRAALELNSKLRRGQFEETEEEQKQETIK
jgi:hypothetical protein